MWVTEKYVKREIVLLEKIPLGDQAAQFRHWF